MNHTLTTPRLILKLPTLSDFDKLYALQTDPNVMKYIGPGVRTKEEVLKFLEMTVQHQTKHGFSLFSVYEKESAAFVGQAGLVYLAYDDTQPDVELGYRLHQAVWGKGYATELAKALIKWGFEDLSLNKLVAVAHPNNFASQKVLKKSGMRYVGNILYWNYEVNHFEIYKPAST